MDADRDSGPKRICDQPHEPPLHGLTRPPDGGITLKRGSKATR